MSTTNKQDAEKRKTFPLGRLFIARFAHQALEPDEVQRALLRHANGDWGDVCEEDRLINEQALIEEDRLFSVYHAASGQKFYIITEWDRSVTTVLLPEEY
jgi:hypothetical protein